MYAKFFKRVIDFTLSLIALLILFPILLILIIIFLGSSLYIGDYYYKSYKNSKNNKSYQDSFYQDVPSVDQETGDTSNTASVDAPISFTELYAQNSDIVGWLRISQTKTDNPVMKGKNDTPTYYEYLKKAFDGRYSKYGTLFAHHSNVFDGKLSHNTIVYGHNMNDGSMLGEAEKLRNLDFYKSNPTLEFTPIYSNERVKWKIFAVILSDTSTSPNLAATGPYNYMIGDFPSEFEFMEYVNEARQRSMISTSVDIIPGDRIITLSTCTYEFKNARLLVMARMVREGEDPSVDTSVACYNSTVVYPRPYCVKKGMALREIVPYTYEQFNLEFGAAAQIQDESSQTTSSAE